jgi:hypothetical protein
MIQYKKKTSDNPIVLREDKEVPYFYFPLQEETKMVSHGFSTRLGGVSKGEFESMNFVTIRGDKIENVKENYRRICTAIGIDWTKLVVSKQTHTTNIKIVSKEDAGKGVLKERGYDNIDGLMTNEPGIPLVTMYADCVPLYFLDPVKKVIALSHSGWRGTVHRMGEVTIQKMQETYGCNPLDILACIGPSICCDCYEVGEEVAFEFKESFNETEITKILTPKPNGKYQLDLWKANELILKQAGILESHLAVTNVCTCCNPELLFSHRFTKGRRGNLAAFLCLND